MGSRVSLSRRDAEDLRDLLGEWRGFALSPAASRRIERLTAVLTPAPKPKKIAAAKARKATRAKKRAAHNDETAEIREAVFDRAGGYCECGCGHRFTAADPGQLDHFWGRIRVRQSVETTWALTMRCHREKTDSKPDRGWWLATFRNHCLVHMYEAEAMRAQARLDAIAAIQAAAAVTKGEG